MCINEGVGNFQLLTQKLKILFQFCLTKIVIKFGINEYLDTNTLVMFPYLQLALTSATCAPFGAIWASAVAMKNGCRDIAQLVVQRPVMSIQLRIFDHS